ncbi:flagellar protein FliT [Clostridium sp. ZS2-4]|uniref:flagellar protein FliT n=1 Tax=Clostridium sp. ZS2-4 TaxID=2987703 RepID=UPI00227B13E9|nr:flagellar protein FliT [Clostridium sp. ZS2-4]MCY6353967.1 flagellar protein FliT [Clostridium sp. ZS2-4]
MDAGNMNLKDKLKEYRDITVKIITSVENEDYDNLDELLSDRQEIINLINQLKYSKKDFLYWCKELDILVLNQKLVKLMNKKKADLRNNINKLTNSQNANKSYNKQYAADSVFFNKKI